jgi:Tol biopolymer transport system component
LRASTVIIEGMNRWWLLLPALLSLALIPAIQANAAFPGRNGKIAFASTRDGDFEIYRMNPDGHRTIQLTHNSATDWAPSVSPSGRRIAFASHRHGDFDIYVMRADGTQKRRLTRKNAGDISPAFSGPRGKRIVFASDRGHRDFFDL